MNDFNPDPSQLYRLINVKMPYGKYAGISIIDLPEPYLVWFEANGFPEGDIGKLLAQAYEIKVNGLEYLFEPLRQS